MKKALFIFFIISLALTFCEKKNKKNIISQNKVLSISTGNVNTSSYHFGRFFKSILKDKIHDYKIDLTNTTGHLSFTLFSDKSVDFAMITESFLSNVLKNNQSEKAEMKGICSLFKVYMLVISNEGIDVNYLQDINKKHRIAIPKTASYNYNALNDVFSAIGKEISDLKIYKLNYDEIINKLIYDKLDIVIISSEEDLSKIEELFLWKEMGIVRIKDTNLKKIDQKTEFINRKVVNLEQLLGKKYDYETIVTDMLLIGHEECPYDAVISLLENYKKLIDNDVQETSSFFDADTKITAQQIVNSSFENSVDVFHKLSIPLHEASKTYFKQIKLLKRRVDENN